MLNREEVEAKLRLVIASGIKSEKRINDMLNNIMANVVDLIIKCPEEKKRMGAVVMTEAAAILKEKPKVL